MSRMKYLCLSSILQLTTVIAQGSFLLPQDNEQFNKHDDLAALEESSHERELFKNDARFEISSNITSGEMAYLAHMNDHITSMDHHTSDNNDTNGPLHLPSESNLFRRKAYSMKRQEQEEKIKTPDEHIRSEKTAPASFLSKTVLSEFYPLSNPYGLKHQNTIIDRVTFAMLQNQVVDESKFIKKYRQENRDGKGKPPKKDSAYFVGLLYLYGMQFDHLTPRTLASSHGGNDGKLLQRPNPVKAVEYLSIAAKEGHADAQCALGLIYYHGFQSLTPNSNSQSSRSKSNSHGYIGSVDRDHKMAMALFLRAAVESNHERSFWLLGRLLCEGMKWSDIGITSPSSPSPPTSMSAFLPESPLTKIGLDPLESSHVQAAKLFERAIKIPEAIHHLAILYEYGLIHPVKSVAGVNTSSSPNFQKAAELYLKASKLGYAESLYHLALMFTHGRGVPLNYPRAIELFRQASKKNHAPSMRYLGLFAMKGYGQPDNMPNPKEAIRWIELCVKFHSVRNIGIEDAREDRTGGSSSSELCQVELEELELLIQTGESYRLRALHDIMNGTTYVP